MDTDGRKPARILVVEDEPMLAILIEEMLADAGFAIAGVAGTLEKALGLVASAGCDAAVVDANLNGLSAAPVAAALTARGLPFIVTSGYSSEQQHEVFPAVRWIQKPWREEQVIEALPRILAIRRSGTWVHPIASTFAICHGPFRVFSVWLEWLPASGQGTWWNPLVPYTNRPNR